MMAGRYGFDTLNWTLFALYFVLSIFFSRRENPLVSLLLIALLVGFWFRVLSRNIARRSAENHLFMSRAQPIFDWLRRMARQLGDFQHRYYGCPRCGQTLRVPRKRGRITITCPRCQNSIVRRT
jgi:hypothetical protein